MHSCVCVCGCGALMCVDLLECRHVFAFPAFAVQLRCSVCVCVCGGVCDVWRVVRGAWCAACGGVWFGLRGVLVRSVGVCVVGCGVSIMRATPCSERQVSPSL